MFLNSYLIIFTLRLTDEVTNVGWFFVEEAARYTPHVQYDEQD